MSLVFNTPKTTLNTTTRDIQNVTSECPPCPECDLETGSAKYTENGSYTLSPEADGFSSVSVTVDVPSDVNNQEKTVTITSNGQSTITADSGYTGLSSVGVTVNVDTTTPYNEGYAAGETAQKAKLTSTTITENGTTTREDGFNSVTVNVRPDLETKTASYNANGQYTITPTAGKDGISEATVTVAVPSDVNNQNKTVTPTTSNQSVTADSGYSGLGTVTVEAVTSSIDANIAAGNIKKDVSILGVTGSYDPQPTLQAKTATPTTSQQVITPDTGNDGLSQVTVNAVTASIDQNISAGNIKSGVTILGVTGTYTGSGGTNVPDWSKAGYTNASVSWLDTALDYSAAIKTRVDGGELVSVEGDEKIMFLPSGTYNKGNNGAFYNCADLIQVPDVTVKTQYQGNTDNMSSRLFMYDHSLKVVGNITYKDNNNNIVYPTSCQETFSQCFALLEIPNWDYSNMTTMYGFLDGGSAIEKYRLERIPLMNLQAVTSVQNMFGRNASFPYLTDGVAGFEKLGKAFTGTSANGHLLNLQHCENLTKSSVMNIINNLSAPDDSTCTDATLKLSSTVYALLDASDIAIATAKNWSITSA